MGNVFSNRNNKKSETFKEACLRYSNDQVIPEFPELIPYSSATKILLELINVFNTEYKRDPEVAKAMLPQIKQTCKQVYTAFFNATKSLDILKCALLKKMEADDPIPELHNLLLQLEHAARADKNLALGMMPQFIPVLEKLMQEPHRLQGIQRTLNLIREKQIKLMLLSLPIFLKIAAGSKPSEMLNFILENISEWKMADLKALNIVDTADAEAAIDTPDATTSKAAADQIFFKSKADTIVMFCARYFPATIESRVNRNLQKHFKNRDKKLVVSIDTVNELCEPYLKLLELIGDMQQIKLNKKEIPDAQLLTVLSSFDEEIRRIIGSRLIIKNALTSDNPVSLEKTADQARAPLLPAFRAATEAATNATLAAEESPQVNNILETVLPGNAKVINSLKLTIE